MITYIVGFFIIAWLPWLPSLLWLVGFPVVGLIIFRYCSDIRSHAFSLLLGMAIALVYGHIQLHYRFDVAQVESIWKVSGVVVQLPDQQGKQARFTLQVATISDQRGIPPNPEPRYMRLSWYKASHILKPGDRLTLNVKLRPPHTLWNPAGFDYERWALARNIDAVGYVKQMLDHQSATDTGVDLLRYRFILWLTERLKDQPVVLSTLQALLLGDKRALEDWQWTLMRNTGTTHLMVVSGLHIGVCVAFGWWFGRLIAVILFRGKEYNVPQHWLPVITALLLSGAYVGLAGFSIPTQRAWIMAAVLLGGQLRTQRPAVWTRWWLSMAVVLTLQPLAMHEIGFWLSFSAVGALLFLVTQRHKNMALFMLLKSQWWILLILSPLLLLFFGQLSLSAPIVNILAIPFVSFVLVVSIPALLISVLGFSWGLDILGVLIKALWAGLSWVNALSDQWVLAIPQPSVIAITFAILGAVMILQPVNVRLKLVGLLCWFPVFLPIKDNVPPAQIRALVFDVGQGLAVLIETNRHTLLFDTGAGYPNGGTAFERAILPYLNQQGISFLDKLVVSHDDNDHAGGVRKVAEQLSLGLVESGMPEALNIPAQNCPSDLSWKWDGVEFRYHHPEPALKATDNDRSCVLEVRSQHCSVLLTGDASVAVESQLLKSMDHVTWLVAGHHGSRTSTSEEFLQAISPEAVLISAGFLNRYRHPHADVIERIERSGSRILRTDQQGAIVLGETRNGKCRIDTWREKEKRYWSAS
ncbi:DNA internalization-related competence protein ComEC/Rec2 [Neptunomonas antarctica]|uniref:Competence protein ComEC n=1 Tax=Neptunomonas antarctica TaxID=619304 RepID=A0A1N7LQQ1_9GAMM|nr:DNA internalization-related competence protein ComEC/Rec2 [Neptunomonas antarctica]SIS76183.1 competence protein ComEC [Neptunomonas antarctica]